MRKCDVQRSEGSDSGVVGLPRNPPNVGGRSAVDPERADVTGCTNAPTTAMNARRPRSPTAGDDKDDRERERGRKVHEEIVGPTDGRDTRPGRPHAQAPHGAIPLAFRPQ